MNIRKIKLAADLKKYFKYLKLKVSVINSPLNSFFILHVRNESILEFKMLSFDCTVIKEDEDYIGYLIDLDGADKILLGWNRKKKNRKDIEMKIEIKNIVPSSTIHIRSVEEMKKMILAATEAERVKREATERAERRKKIIDSI